MAFHREQAELEMIASGMTREAARYEAQKQFGNTARIKERSHEVIAFKLETIALDLKFALRQLRRNPGFALTAIVILALGMGASLSIFAFVDAALIKPLPYPSPTRLVDVAGTTATSTRDSLSYANYIDLKHRNTVFSSFDVYAGHRFDLSTPTGTESVHGEAVSAGFFKTLGVRPALGRDFLPAEGSTGAAPVMLVSYGAWQRRFGGRQEIVGQAVMVGGVAYTIVGVLPKEFEFEPRDIAEFWDVVRPDKDFEQERGQGDFSAIARLKNGATVASGAADLKTIAQQLEKQYPDANRGRSASVMPLSEAIVGQVKPILLVLLGSAGMLLLIAFVNVSSLLLVRAESRRSEIAVRGALGASELRLSRQFITEAVALVAAGSLLGLAIAYAGVRGLSSLISQDWLAGMPYLRGLGIDAPVLVFAACLATLASFVFSTAPIVHFKMSSMRAGLAQGGRRSGGTLWRRMGANLVVIELATAVMLLAGAGLLCKSFYKLLNEDLGFRPDHLATVNVSLPSRVFTTSDQQVAFEHAVLERARGMAGVQSAAAIDMLPVSCNCGTDEVRFAGKSYNGVPNVVNVRHISAGLFTTLQARLKSGRFFTDADDATSPGVVIINQSFAKKYFAGEDPIGRKIGDAELTPSSMREIVGVVEDFKDAGLDEEQWPAEYEPFDQSPDGYFDFVIRTSQDAGSILPALAPMIHAVNSNVSVDWQRTMQGRIDDSGTADIHRSAAWLVGGFALLALVMGVVGLYGVIAYSVSQRTREIGVRMALGARRGSVYRLILGEAGWLIGIGMALGLAGTLVGATLLGKLLFGVQAWDAETLVGVALVLGVSAMLASYLPARRAASVNPTEALRSE